MWAPEIKHAPCLQLFLMSQGEMEITRTMLLLSADITNGLVSGNSKGKANISGYYLVSKRGKKMVHIMKFPWQRKVMNPKVKFEFTTLHRTSSCLSTTYTNTLKSCSHLILKWILGNRITFGQWNTWLTSVNNQQALKRSHHSNHLLRWSRMPLTIYLGCPRSVWPWYIPNMDATGSGSSMQDSFLLMFIVEACHWKLEREEREWDWSAGETKTLQCLTVLAKHMALDAIDANCAQHLFDFIREVTLAATKSE